MPIISKLLELSLTVFGVPFGFIVFFLVPTLILSVPAWIFCKKQACLVWWEMGLPLYGMIFWLLCMMLFRIIDIKGETLVNLYVEPFVIGVLSLIIIYLRSFFFYKFFENQKTLSLIGVAVLLVLILLMRVFIPALPE